MLELDLDAIEARANRATKALANWRDGDDTESGISQFAQSADDVPALVAEVRRLRAEREALRTILHRKEHWTTTAEALEGILGGTTSADSPKPTGSFVAMTHESHGFCFCGKDH